MATKFHVWSKAVNLHLGFQILDFPSCPPTFPQCLCIEEFQSKYHRGEQIWAQIWQNQKMELFKLPFSEVLKSPSKSLFCKENVTSSFFWGCHPSPLLSNVRGALALSRFHLHDFFGIFAVARFSSEGFLQQSRKHGWVPLYFTFSLILPSSASSQMQFQVCISSNKTIEVFSECFNFSKNNFWWYNLKRLELTNFWHNMPSAAAKIFRRNFSTKIEVADKKFCTSYIT